MKEDIQKTLEKQGKRKKAEKLLEEQRKAEELLAQKKAREIQRRAQFQRMEPYRQERARRNKIRYLDSDEDSE